MKAGDELKRERSFRKKINTGCDCEDYCPCGNEERISCEDCLWYRFQDSGCGICIAMPDVITVPWCRIVCSLFKEKK